MTVPVTLPPSPAPSRQDPVNFEARADAYHAWLVPAVAQMNSQNAENNALNADVNSQVATALDAGLASAAANAAAAIANAAIAADQNAQSNTQASAAQAGAAAAATARDQSIAAWVASTAPAEVLPAISQSIHVGTVVKSIIYRTDLDSDGGSWRKRCTDKSWFTEALGGNRWIGQQATIAAAWTAAGSTTGAVFQASATAGPIVIGRYYSANSSTTVTEVFRGIAREFPEQVAIVAESGRVVIYDLTVPGCPMWMVFTLNANNAIGTSSAVTSVTAINGVVIVGSALGAVHFLSFIRDIAYRQASNASETTAMIGTLSRRNALPGRIVFGQVSPIVSSSVNDIAAVILPNAPIDPATGLPVPTIAVFTPAGFSVIRDSGAVVNVTRASGYRVGSILGENIVAQDLIGTTLEVGRIPTATTDSVTWRTGFYTATSVPAISVFRAEQIAQSPGAIHAGSPNGGALLSIRENPATRARGMVAKISTTFNAGYEVGDSRLAALADTVAETITAPELVTNGTFNTDITGWTNASTGTGTFVWETGYAKIQGTDGSNRGSMIQIVPVVSGKRHRLTLTSLDAAYFGVSLPGATDIVGLTANGIAAVGVATVFFTPSSSTQSIGLFTGSGTSTCRLDNISVKLAEPDRSVKNNGLNIVGTLTKTAVSVGAQLVAYSGFSASNYLEQPYSANMDFGTGDFCVMGWANVTGPEVRMLGRRAFDGAVVTGARFLLSASSSGALFFIGDGTNNYSTPTSGAVLSNTGWRFLCGVKRSGLIELWLDGVFVGSTDASACGSLNNGNALLTGGFVSGLSSFPTNGSLALLRVSATAPSADQIAQIYRDELPLFQPNAQCTIAGTSTAVTALAYDESTDLLHVGTSWGRSGFKGLLRTESEATATGAITSLSAVQGAVLTGGTSARHWQPALQLRDELARKEEARRALGRVPVFQEFTATASQTAFVVAKGYTIRALYRNGTLMREATTGVFWTRSFDGYQETATLSVGATAGDWISLMCVRSN